MAAEGRGEPDMTDDNRTAEPGGATGSAQPTGPAQPIGVSSEGHFTYRGTGWWGGRRGFPWLGALLIAFGAALVVEETGVGITTGDALALFAGLVFAAAFLLSGSGATGVLAAVLTGWGLTRTLGDLGYVSGDGWTALLIGAGFLAMYLVGLARQGRHGWTLWIGLALVLLGAAQVALREVPGFPHLDAYVVPVLLIVVGALLIGRAVRPRA
jgi:hypothetical protein